MVALFRTNQSFVNLLLYGYALLLQLPVFLLDYPAAGGEPVSYYGNLLYQWVSGYPILASVLPPLLVATAGVLANTIASRYRLSRRATQLPGMAVVLLWSVSPAFRTFDLRQVTFILLFAFLGALARTYRRKGEEVSRFNAGFWLGLATLLVPTHLLYLPVAVIGIGIYRTATPRNVLQLIGGMVVVYLLAAAGAFWRGDLANFAAGQTPALGAPYFLPAGRYALVGAGLVLVPLAAVLLVKRRENLLSIEGRKNVLFCFWLLLFSLPVGLLGWRTALSDAQAIVPALGMLWGLWFGRRRESRAEFVHLLMVAAASLLTVLHGLHGPVVT
jgi:hypothetical protein